MISGRDFLVLADQWCKGNAEGEWRTAVSRAYYAAFHEARRLFRELGFVVPRADQAHAYLWMRLCNCGDAAAQSAGADLNQLRRRRNSADYDIDQHFTRADAKLYVGIAHRVLNVLGSIRQEPARTQVTDAMKVYERDVLKVQTWQPPAGP